MGLRVVIPEFLGNHLPFEREVKAMSRSKADPTADKVTKQFTKLLGNSVTENPTKRTDCMHLLVTDKLKPEELTQIRDNNIPIAKGRNFPAFALTLHRYGGGQRVFVPVKKNRNEDPTPSALGKLCINDANIPTERVDESPNGMGKWYAAQIRLTESNVTAVAGLVKAHIVSLSPAKSSPAQPVQTVEHAMAS